MSRLFPRLALSPLCTPNSIPYPHLLDSHTASPTQWRRRITDILLLLGPDWRDPEGTMNGTVANGTPSNRLCAGILNFLDSEKTSEVVRGWKQDGFPDATAFGGAIDYGDVPLSNFLSVIERITLKDREASTSTSLLRAQRGLRDPSLE